MDEMNYTVVDGVPMCSYRKCPSHKDVTLFIDYEYRERCASFCKITGKECEASGLCVPGVKRHTVLRTSVSR